MTVFGTFSNQSDRAAKQDFAPINPAAILDKVVQLPLSEWSYRENPGTRHIGPMAQDFHAAFGLGIDERHITPLDEGGVALAAIQGLNAKVESEKQKAESQMEELKAENAELNQRLTVLEQLVATQLNGGVK